jgi:hypothetical protein
MVEDFRQADACPHFNAVFGWLGARETVARRTSPQLETVTQTTAATTTWRALNRAVDREMTASQILRGAFEAVAPAVDEW